MFKFKIVSKKHKNFGLIFLILAFDIIGIWLPGVNLPVFDGLASQINGRTKYVTVRDAILDLSYLMPGDGEEKRLHKVKKWNDYLVHIRSKSEKEFSKNEESEMW